MTEPKPFIRHGEPEAEQERAPAALTADVVHTAPMAARDTGHTPGSPGAEPSGWIAEALAPPGSPLTGAGAEQRVRGELKLEHEAEELERRWRVLYESGDEHAEMAVIFDVLRRAKVTGRIGTDVAARLISVLTDAQRGHLHAALRGPRNRLPPSVQEEDEMAIAWTYIQVVRQGLVPDRTPYVTVGNAYGASREEIRAWRRRLPEAEALNRWRLFANLEARADPGLWKPLLDIAGGSYRERKEATAEKRDEKHKRAEASERMRKGIKGQN